MAPRSSVRLVDRLLDGKLEQELRSRRAANESFETIAQWLNSAHSIDTTGTTVRRWCIDLGIEAA